MSTKYVDIPSVMHVIGNIFQNQALLDNENYKFIEDDFPTEFHKVLFGSIYNLHKDYGISNITTDTVEDYLRERPKSLAIYKTNKGAEYLLKVSEMSQLSTFDYYYQRMKKMTLLRMYDSIGMDLSWIYDVDNILDVRKKQAQEDWLDNTSINEIADIIDGRITEIKIKYTNEKKDDFTPAGEGIVELIESFQKNPELGYPLFGNFINTITGGARLKKFYLRSAATGVGKTRGMIADCCYIACDKIYDRRKRAWINIECKQPALFITTEQEIEEIQTMMLSFLSDVNEEHILHGEFKEDELERVMEAAKILKESQIIIKRLPDFSIEDVENTIRYSVHHDKTEYIFFDYLHTSMKILSEVSSKTGIKGLREDNVLFMLSIKLKDICNKYKVFIMTATQLNADYKEAQIYDQNLLRGAKSIADKIDVGMIMLQTSKEDKEALKPLLIKHGLPEPGIKISIYKNRRGQYKDVLLWCRANRGTCRIEPIFVTDYQYKLVEIDELKIVINPKKGE